MIPNNNPEFSVIGSPSIWRDDVDDDRLYLTLRFFRKGKKPEVETRLNKERIFHVKRSVLPCLSFGSVCLDGFDQRTVDQIPLFCLCPGFYYWIFRFRIFAFLWSDHAIMSQQMRIVSPFEETVTTYCCPCFSFSRLLYFHWCHIKGLKEDNLRNEQTGKRKKERRGIQEDKKVWWSLTLILLEQTEEEETEIRK